MADRLVPRDEWGPGAVDADVGTFFRAIFADQRLATIHPLLKRGCSFMMRVAKAETKQAFTSLDGPSRDEIIRRLVENAMRPDGFSGPMFVRIVMALTLEGFLGDPRHGGNKDGIGWKTVGFSPEGRAQGQGLPVLP
jgi:gluconate 2-dehydrogenase gamma chain